MQYRESNGRRRGREVGREVGREGGGRKRGREGGREERERGRGWCNMRGKERMVKTCTVSTKCTYLPLANLTTLSLPHTTCAVLGMKTTCYWLWKHCPSTNHNGNKFKGSLNTCHLNWFCFGSDFELCFERVVSSREKGTKHFAVLKWLWCTYCGHTVAWDH